jgi:hypothetical protein
MFGKRKCDATPVFKTSVHADTADRVRSAVTALRCPSGAELTPVSLQAPSAAALVTASHLPDAVWMYAHRLQCSRCKKVCSVPVSQPATGPAPNNQAVRSKARPDFYALQQAFLPEWFLNRPQDAITILTTRLDSWQAQAMKQIGGVVERSDGAPLPIRGIQPVGTPGDTNSLLVDFMEPCAPVEAHHALLVGGSAPRFFLSEKTHLGDDSPVIDMAGLTEWAFANAERTDMKHTAIEMLPEVSRSAFLNAAVDLLKRSLA